MFANIWMFAYAFLKLCSVNVCLCVCVSGTARMYRKHMQHGCMMQRKNQRNQNLQEYFGITYQVAYLLRRKKSENLTIWQKAMIGILALSWVRRGQTSDWPLEEFSGLSIHSRDCVTWLHVMMASSWCAVGGRIVYIVTSPYDIQTSHLKVHESSGWYQWWPYLSCGNIIVSA